MTGGAGNAPSPPEPAFVAECAAAKDARGTVRHCNAFDMAPVRRFYTIANSAEQPVRGWIAHRRETKWFLPLSGVTRIHAAPCPDPDGAPPDVSRARVFELDASAPRVLSLPPGNALAIEQRAGAEVMVFSDRPLAECAGDTWRFPFGGCK